MWVTNVKDVAGSGFEKIFSICFQILVVYPILDTGFFVDYPLFVCHAQGMTLGILKRCCSVTSGHRPYLFYFILFMQIVAPIPKRTKTYKK